MHEDELFYYCVFTIYCCRLGYDTLINQMFQDSFMLKLTFHVIQKTVLNMMVLLP